jgi:hypothetical protein
VRAKEAMARSPAGPGWHRHSVGPPELAGPQPGGLAAWGEASKHSALAPATGAETEIETRRRWAEWSSFALSSSSSAFYADASAAGGDEDNNQSGRDSDEEPPKRHPLEVAATERFLAADLRRRVHAAQAQMPPLTIAEKISLPAWMSWGRGSVPHHGGHEREVVCTMHNGDSPSVSTGADASPKRGRMSRAMRKLRKRLPRLPANLGKAAATLK